ncbi:PDR/VanB family oxidoreductase [Gordonia sp. CPCC 205515]|uniref:PDR/VanB family oxidoreductase n=1 Tax=Gordonia sp. CPCC 205515 TaxID=3140791 RepID=UPI003AF3E854
MTPQSTNTLRVRDRTVVARDVVALTLDHPDGRRLADWAPGAHIDVILPNGLTRQYSLCGDRWDAYTYRIAVRREADSRGGSSYIHDELRVGDLVGIGGPRNNFRMAPATRYLFIAGGIGITPMLPMVAQAEIVGAEWDLLYCGRYRDTMAFADDLGVYGDRVSIVASSESGRTDLATLLTAVDEDTRVYVCGPQSFLDDVTALTQHWPVGRLRLERFTAQPGDEASRSIAFELELARSGHVVTVAPEVGVLDALADAGIGVLSSCREGLCGTCETTVLDGVPDHRDSVLDDDERAANNCMLVCVSRACSDRLVLDL